LYFRRICFRADTLKNFERDFGLYNGFDGLSFGGKRLGVIIQSHRFGGGIANLPREFDCLQKIAIGNFFFSQNGCRRDEIAERDYFATGIANFDREFSVFLI